MKYVDSITDDAVTIAAIAGITFLGYHGVIDAIVIGSIAGLGGYRIHQHRKNNKEE